ncbi:hypothetical protein CHISP_0252 [Chitinispirillum alkaliphilum]|nr:hypothetical protein CHISP_0252 [Chitinispirillum alkaliphilum]
MQSGYGQRAYASFVSGNYLEALDLYRRSYDQARRADLPRRAVHDRFNMGRVFYELSKLDSAIAVFNQVHREMVHLEQFTFASRAAAFVALCYAHLGKSDSADHWHQNYREYSELSDPVFGEMIAARLSWIMHKNSAAYEVFDKIADLHRRQKNYSALARTLFYMAEIRFEQGKLEEVELKLRESLNVLNKVDESFWRWNVLLSLAALYFCQGDPGSGSHYYYRAARCLPSGLEIPGKDQLLHCGWLYR